MEYTNLGRTGLRVSVAGLGCGGNSRLGLGSGKSEKDAIALVRAAWDAGVNIFDTAAVYGTEEVLGKALKGLPRDRLVVTTKARFGRLSPAETVASLDRSLKLFGLDYVDLFQLHGVTPGAYGHARQVMAPALLKERDKGKFRFLGMTESSPHDPEHKMIPQAVADGVWDTMMVGFHMMHQNARRAVFPLTMKEQIGTLLMFVVRNIFSQPERLRSTLRELVGAGQLPASLGREQNPLGFLVHEGGARSITDAAYRFARHEPGVDVVLFGTGEIAHLRDNVASILSPPLPAADRARLAELFGHLSGVGLDLPGFAGGPPQS